MKLFGEVNYIRHTSCKNNVPNFVLIRKVLTMLLLLNCCHLFSIYLELFWRSKGLGKDFKCYRVVKKKIATHKTIYNHELLYIIILRFIQGDCSWKNELLFLKTQYIIFSTNVLSIRYSENIPTVWHHYGTL